MTPSYAFLSGSGAADAELDVIDDNGASIAGGDCLRGRWSGLDCSNKVGEQCVGWKNNYAAL